jgi:predicted esterase
LTLRHILLSLVCVLTTVITVSVSAPLPLTDDAGRPHPTRSALAVQSLRQALAKNSLKPGELATQDFARVPLTKADAQQVRELLWDDHAARIRRERATEVKARLIKASDHEMKFDIRTFGEKPATGRSLWFSLHGGGQAPKEVNDGQYENQKRLYRLKEGLYLVPRAPTNASSMWHYDHIDRLFDRLIEDLIVLEDVDPDRVFLMGYSAGGDGVYQLAPRMADRYAAAAMMAGHPNNASPLSLRNLPFALQVGGKDAAYNRNGVARKWEQELARLRKEDPGGYPQFVKIYEDKGHWMDREDAVALPWMAKFSRNPVPDRIVWHQGGVTHDRSYWLALPPDQIRGGTLVIVEKKGQTIDIQRADGIEELLLRLDDRVVDLEKTVIVQCKGRTLFEGRVPRTIGTLARSLAGRGDPKLMFEGEVRVDVSK